MALGQVSPSTSVSLANSHPPNVPYSLIILSLTLYGRDTASVVK
jgi:hypothetical protein